MFVLALKEKKTRVPIALKTQQERRHSISLLTKTTQYAMLDFWKPTTTLTCQW